MTDTTQNLYIVFTHPLDGAGDRGAVRDAHKLFRSDLEAKGILVAGGPIIDEATGKTSGSGMAIIRAASASIAAEIIQSDPFVEGGFRSFEISTWRVQNGQL